MNVNMQDNDTIMMLAREGLQVRLHKQQLQTERLRRAQMRLRALEDANKKLKELIYPTAVY